MSPSDRLAAIVEIWHVLATKRKFGNTARLAVLGVGRACDVVHDATLGRIDLDFRHEPEVETGRPHDPSHAGIYGIPDEDNLVAQLLSEAVIEVHSAPPGRA